LRKGSGAQEERQVTRVQIPQFAQVDTHRTPDEASRHSLESDLTFQLLEGV